MGDYLFRFKIFGIEFGMYKHFKTFWFNNGYIKEFMWWYMYKD